MNPFKPKCDHTDTRLTCQDCSGAICPRCMVPCAVGSRCPKCASKFQSHAVKTTPWLLARTGLAALVVGFAFGALESSFSSGIIIFFFLYFAGVIVGKGLHWVARYKLGAPICTAVVLGLIAGFLLSPVHSSFLSAIMYAVKPTVPGTEGALTGSVTCVVWHLFAMAVFTYGALSPFLRRA